MSKSLSIFALASLLHGAWAQSDENTTAPTPGPNDCDGFLPGDIYFTYVKSLEPDEVVLFPYEDIPGGLKLYLTDNAWTGSGFQTDEGTLEFTTPATGIPQGANFGYGPNAKYGNDWVPVEGAFALDPKGEQVFLFCIGSMEIVPLAAISYNGPFQTEGLESYGLNESALPERLTTNGTIVLEHCDTWEYAGVAKAQVDVLKRSMTNINNWKGESCGVGAGGFTVRLSWLELTLAIGLGSLLLLN